MVEAFAIDADDGALRHEGLRVEHLDEAEHVDALVLLGEDTEYLDVLSCVPAVSVENGDAVVHLRADGIGYLLPLLGEDHELYRLAAGVHHVVEHEVLEGHHAEAEHHLVGPLDVVAKLREEHTGADDAEVDGDEHGAERHVVILVDGGGNNVGTARRAVVQEDRSEGDARDDAADDHRHEVLSLAQQLDGQSVVLGGHDGLCQHEQQVERKDGIDGLHHELEAQDFERHDE